VCGKNVEKTVDAIEYVAQLLGNADSIAVGSDFDGAVKTHFDASGIPLLTQALKSRGFTDQDIRRIMGENLRDFLLTHLPVWSKNSSSFAVSKKLKFFNGDEFIEGTGSVNAPIMLS